MCIRDSRNPNREDNDNPLAPAWFRERQRSDPAGAQPLVDPRTSATVPSPGYDPNRFFGVDANTLNPEWYHQQGFMAGGDWESVAIQTKHLERNNAYPIDLDATQDERGVRFTVVMYEAKALENE